MAKRIDPKHVPAQVGTFYPPPFDQPCRARERRKLGDACGLTQFGVNLLRLAARRLVQPAPLAHRAGRVCLCAVRRSGAGHRCRRRDFEAGRLRGLQGGR